MASPTFKALYSHRLSDCSGRGLIEQLKDVVRELHPLRFAVAPNYDLRRRKGRVEECARLLYPDQRITLRALVEPHDPISLAVWNGNKQSRESVAFRAVGWALLRRRIFRHRIVLCSKVFSQTLAESPPFLIRQTGGQSRFSGGWRRRCRSSTRMIMKGLHKPDSIN